MDETLVRKILDHDKMLDNISTQDVKIYGKMSTRNISVTPTDNDIDLAMGDTPANLGTGFIGLINDNASGPVVLVVSDGTKWWYTILTEAL